IPDSNVGYLRSNLRSSQYYHKKAYPPNPLAEMERATGLEPATLSLGKLLYPYLFFLDNITHHSITII
ncbi:MAG: hypothetical protein Q8M92_01545, partial [Candidatus Subteraquimicrobiales bacterium]|nr:hypothetical protein [Candidatus Subteraquimicrobiales bacterium]